MSVTSLPDFLEETLGKIFFDPNDDVSSQTLNDYISPAFQWILNGDTLARDAFVRDVQRNRSGQLGRSVGKNETLALVLINEAKQTGVVAQRAKFAIYLSGTETVLDTIMVAKVEEVDGKRQLTSLVEVINF